MPTDPLLAIAYYLTGRLRARLTAARGGQPDRGALSLEWVAIAIVLVAAALALAAFLTGKLGDIERQIP